MNTMPSARRPGAGLPLLAVVLLPLTPVTPARAVEEVAVPNYSFESPVTVFVDVEVDDWEEPGPGSPGPTQDTGVFLNVPESPAFVEYADGTQLAFMGATDNTGIAFFQQLADTFVTGRAYALTVSVGESSTPPFMPCTICQPEVPEPPAQMAISLYYDSNGTKTVVAERVVSQAELPGRGIDGGYIQQVSSIGLAVVDRTARSATVALTDPWAGQPIGVMIRPVLGMAGIWNLDNVRVCPLGAYGDVDLDGDVDASDFAYLPECLSGPGNAHQPAGCEPCAFARLDADADSDVDLDDFAAFMRDFGPI